MIVSFSPPARRPRFAQSRRLRTSRPRGPPRPEFRHRGSTVACGAALYGRRMLARAITHALVGLEPRRVDVEVHIDNGIPGFAIVGLVDRAVQEAKDRIRSGIASAHLEFPNRRITVNLAPAQLRKEGSAFDLPIALAILAAWRQFPPERLDEHASVGELGLDGRLRRVGGVLAVAEAATRAAIDRLICPVDSAAEAALAGVQPVPARHLAEA